jgi:hypothetical protein
VDYRPSKRSLAKPTTIFSVVACANTNSWFLMYDEALPRNVADTIKADLLVFLKA